MRDIPKSARVDKDKNKETLEIVYEFIKYLDFDYDFDNIKNELSFFDDIPTEHKDKEISYFLMMLHTYINQNKNTQRVREDNKINKKYIKSIKTILDILDSLESKSTDTKNIINFDPSILLLFAGEDSYHNMEIAREVLELLEHSLHIKRYGSVINSVSTPNFS